MKQRGATLIPGILRQGVTPDRPPTIAVRRTYNNLMYDITDRWDVAAVADNLHPSHSPVRFSSNGSLTIRGVFSEGKHTLEFAQFRSALGLSESSLGADDGKRVDIVLLTGLDAAVAAGLEVKQAALGAEERRTHIERLRFGSRSERVRKLRQAIGLPESDTFDTATVVKLAELQQAKLKWSDGIYAPEMDRLLGLCVFGPGC